MAVSAVMQAGASACTSTGHGTGRPLPPCGASAPVTSLTTSTPASAPAMATARRTVGRPIMTGRCSGGR